MAVEDLVVVVVEAVGVGVEGVDRVVGVEAEDLVEAAAAVEAADLVVVEAVAAADLAAGRRAVVAPWTR